MPSSPEVPLRAEHPGARQRYTRRTGTAWNGSSCGLAHPVPDRAVRLAGYLRIQRKLWSLRYESCVRPCSLHSQQTPTYGPLLRFHSASKRRHCPPGVPVILRSFGGRRELLSASDPDKPAPTCRKYVWTDRPVQKKVLIFPGQRAISVPLKLYRQSHHRQNRVCTAALPYECLPGTRSAPSGASEAGAGFLKIRM